jgi:hypothetical protein
LSTSSGPDPFGTALAAIVIGAASGGALLCTVLIAAHDMPRGVDTPFADIVLAAAAGGLTVAAGAAGLVGRGLGAWRRAVVAMIAAAGTALVGVLTTAADMAGGRAGLAVLGGLCLGAILLAARVFFGRDPG